METLGKYEILGRLGEGGFGTVWKGRDPFLKRLVAIKTCSSEDEGLRRRFLREAEVVGALDHPNIVRVHDFGYQDEVPFLVQELLSGEDLSDLQARHAPLSLPKRLRILADVARGLEHAHARGIVHRDVKPSNVRVVDGGQAKVMDFGIAKLAQTGTRLTQTGTSLGTVAYMAPEQIEGGEVDHRADIFAFGVMTYELIAGVRPFDADTMSRVFYRILHEEPRPLPEAAPGTPPEIAELVARCLAKAPAERWSSCAEIAAELERQTARLSDSSFAESTVVTPAAPPTTAALAPTPTAPPRSSPSLATTAPRAPWLTRHHLAWLAAAMVVVVAGLWLALRSPAPGAPAHGAASARSSGTAKLAEARAALEQERLFAALRAAVAAETLDPSLAEEAKAIAATVVDRFSRETTLARRAADAVDAARLAPEPYARADAREDEAVRLLALGKLEDSILAFDESRREFAEATAAVTPAAALPAEPTKSTDR